MPPTSAAVAHFHHAHFLPNNDSRPATPSHYRSTVVELQSVLYRGRGSDKEEIEEFVNRAYDSNACFENPVSLARGRNSITELFALLAVVPGKTWSEINDVAESQGYDGNRLVVLQHTLHIAFLPFLDPNHDHHSPNYFNLQRSMSFFSLPATPFPQATPPLTNDIPLHESTSSTFSESSRHRDESHGIFSKTHPASKSTRWPLANALLSLSPRNVALNLTTWHLKFNTRLTFNEHGKIIHHEDSWGLKEIVEGVFPVVSHLYELGRTAIGGIMGIGSRVLLGGDKQNKDNNPDSASRDYALKKEQQAGFCPMDDEEFRIFGAGSPMHTRKNSVSSITQNSVTTGKRIETSGLGLVDSRENELSTAADAYQSS